MSEYYPPPSFYFTVTIPGDIVSADARFMEVSGISMNFNTEEISVGGENRFKYKGPTHPSYDNLVLKRGLVTSPSPLALWCEGQAIAGLAAPIVTLDILVSLLGPSGIPLMAWTIVGAWPVKWNVSGFDSTENKIAIETLELSYNYFVPIPMSLPF